MVTRTPQSPRCQRSFNFALEIFCVLPLASTGFVYRDAKRSNPFAYDHPTRLIEHHLKRHINAFRTNNGHVIHPPNSASLLPSTPWGIADDWSSLSSDTPDDDIDPFSHPIVPEITTEHSLPPQQPFPISDDDRFVQDTIDFIYHNGALYSDPSDPPLYDTEESFESFVKSPQFVDEIGDEIGLLVRCNESPETLLVEQGRAVPSLTDAERYDIDQLVTAVAKEGIIGAASSDGGKQQRYKTTTFFDLAVDTIFYRHARPEGTTGEHVLDASAVAQWMTKCLGDSVGRHDKRVAAAISRYSTYGTGRLTEGEFHRLYFDAVCAGLETHASAGFTDSELELFQIDQPTVEGVWRDFIAYDIRSPAEEEHARLEEELERERGRKVEETTTVRVENLMDECEILDWGSEYRSEEGERRRRSSYELVELASDGETPMRIRDGKFVFIDEESCIGCNQCVQIAPSSFLMEETGRARTFHQSNLPEVPIAVSACPVNCMHNVAFHELKEFESARDDGDGRNDHKHMGRRQGHTPLYVQGIDSDANHMSSWYHYLKQKCYLSSNCPQRGCYDCPSYSNPGDNPFFKKRMDEADRIRARDVISSGDADFWRKTADL